MTRDEMLKKIKQGEPLIDIVIDKWKDVRDILEFDINFGPGTCAYCELYQTLRELCGDCPIFEFTGEALCTNTPYKGVTISYEKLRDSVRKEIDFLESLKKHLEKMGESNCDD